ncbi:hypothetical protein [Variovorax saccharolyticus]|uniref:hypothetical protein n=1 Tax=Variovorax saccharolyticus TaxID=3053516 RepID=UPI002576E933|nr:hypothetical protein [Variovorax sp. J22R187]MDM0022187.1 hypothetical protein [Variovorax sp. J22R187]
MVLTLYAYLDGKSYRIGWISLQPNGDISGGLNDRAFVAREFTAQLFVWSVFNRVRVAYLVPDDPKAARPIDQPHLTFHVPAYLHLTSKGNRVTFEAIADIALAVDQQGEVPWVRFTSRPLSSLTEAKGGTRDIAQRTVEFAATAADRSIELAVDFVRPGDTTALTGANHCEWLDHGACRLRISATECAPQRPTLGWFHES